MGLNDQGKKSLYRKMKREGIISSSKVSIIIINFKETNNLEKNLNSVVKTNYSNFEILLIDCCTPDFENWVKKYPQIKYFHFEEDLGPAMMRNIGLKNSDKLSKYVCFMDDDVIVTTPNWLTALVEIMENDSGIGEIQPMLLNYSDKTEIDSLGHYLTQIGFPIKIQNSKENVQRLKSQKIMEIFYGETALVFVRKKVLDILSDYCEPFDSEYYVLYEDVDFSWKIWSTGFKVVISYDPPVYHMRGLSGGPKKANFRFVFLNERNRIMTLLKNHEMVSLLKYLPITIFIMLIKAVYLLNKKPNHSKAILKAIFWVMFHYPSIWKKRSVSILKKHSVSNFQIDNVFVKTNFRELRNQLKRQYQ